MNKDNSRDQNDPVFSLSASRHFPSWLSSIGGSIAFTTYQAGKLFFLGIKADGTLSVFNRSFTRCMGLAVSEDGQSLALATQNNIQRFDNILPPDQTAKDDYDRLYAPHAGWVTGDLDAHDMAWGRDGRPIFVNTLMGCIATVSDGHSFKPLWRPPFLTDLAPEDRCHLNGMAVKDGEPHFATAVSRSNVADGWRDRRHDGGIVMDVRSDQIVAEGLSMPHSPRFHNGKLWLLNSGRGELGMIDPESGRFEAVAFCPGYARGLTFAGKYAIVGLSLARESKTFAGLALEDELASRDAEARCGLAVFDTDSGHLVHWVRIEGVVRELYDVALIPHARQPSAIGFKTEEVGHYLSIES